MMTSRILVLILLALVLSGHAISQYKDSDFKKYTTADGLTDGYINAIVQDSLGYIWIGTFEGLNKFDGNTFDRFFYGSPKAFLASSVIRKLKLFGGKIGVITLGGFQIFDPLNLRIENYFIPDSTSFVALRNAAWDADLLLDGKLAVSTTTGFYVFHRDGSLYFRYDAYHPQDKSTKRILYGRQIVMVPYPDVLVYVESRDLMQYNVKQNTFTKIDSSSFYGKFFSHRWTRNDFYWITKAQTGPQEHIFLSVDNNLIYYDFSDSTQISSPIPFHGEKAFSWKSSFHKLDEHTFALTGASKGFYLIYLNKEKQFIQMDPTPILSGSEINVVFKDKDDRIWVGSTDGIYAQIKMKSFFERFSWPSEHAIYAYTDALLHKGNLYISRFADEAGLLVVDHTTMKRIKEVSFYNDKEWNFIMSIQMYHPDTLWLATQKGVLWYAIESGTYAPVYYDRPTKKILGANILNSPDDHGIAWCIRSLAGIIWKYDVAKHTFQTIESQSQPPIPFHQAKHIAYDAYGDAWIGGHALARWEHDSNRTDTIFSTYGGHHPFNENIISMTADRAGSLWLHNAGNGLLQYKIKEATYAHFDIADGLPTNNFKVLSPVVDDILFLQSSHHLTRFDTRTKKIEIFGQGDNLGLQSDIPKKMYWESSSKQMYAFYRDAVIRFPLSRPPQKYSSSDLLIQNIIFDHQDTIWYPESQIRVKGGNHTLIISYTVIDFEEGKNYLFAYKLGKAGDWINLGNQRKIYLSNVSAGKQTLTIRSTGLSGEQKTSTLAFTIQAPLWQRPWLIMMASLVFVLFSFLFYKRRISRVKEKAAIDSMLAESEMKALHAQMNPHFVFNSLNSIREMIFNKQTEEASRYLSDFAQLIRITLDHSNHAYISLRSTIEYLNKYIEMEKIRSGNFNISLNCDHLLDPDEASMPPMLIQPFIENAIWHGSKGYKSKLKIDITFKKQDDRMVCVIEDNGIGISQSLAMKKKSTLVYESVGIANIEKRIELLNKKYNYKSTIMIEDKGTVTQQNATGTIVTISLPLDPGDE